MKAADIKRVRNFCDLWIGPGYYSIAELEDITARSIATNGTICSFMLVDREENLLGIRISYPPLQWRKGKGEGLKPELWKVSVEHVGYFQSLFLAETVQGKGWGQKLSLMAIGALREAGAKAIATHAWVESPHDSSRKYLRKIGFGPVATHPLYWNKVDYTCPRCGKPCVCTAEEMIKYL